MNWNTRVRPVHRWLGITFAATVVITVVALALSGPIWISYIPLLPLALLFFSGAYMYVVSFTTRGGPAPQGTPVRSGLVRQTHRWSAVVFAVSVLVTSIALAQAEPIVWVSYIPLFPLLLLLITGLTMFVQSRRTTA